MPGQTLEAGGLTLAGGTLLATEDDRTFRARLVPFGEVAQSNLGRFSVPGPGVLTLPTDIRTMVWNDGHNRERPVASTVLLAEQPDGVHASIRIADGPDGDAILAGIRDGSRNRVSVEARDMVIEDGVARGGHVFGAAIVTPGRSGAFPSATLLAMAEGTLLADAADDATDPEDPTQAAYSTMEVDPVTGATFETDTTVEETEETDPDTGATVITTTTTTVRTETPGAAPAEGSAPVPAQTPAPATAPLLATRAPGSTVPRTLLEGRRRRQPQLPETVAAATLYAMLAAASPRGRGQGWNTRMLEQLRSPRVMGSLYAESPETLLAELEDVTFDAAGSPRDMIVPQWIGELWGGRAFQRRWVPLFNSGTLTSDTVKGWRWVDGKTPEVDYYAGNKTDVPSNELDTEPYDVPAQAIAGAHDVDRRYRDFNVPEFWDGYFRGMTESYARKSDAYVPRELFDATNNATTSITAGVVPAGVSPVMTKIVDGALAVLDEDLPSWAVVTKADYRDLLLTKDDDKLAYLNSALGLEEGAIENFRVVPAETGSPLEAASEALVGCRSAATVHELAGSPIRIEGLDVARGGIDPGLFGYVALAVHNPRALVRVKPHA
jgi:hypothetical protein